MKNLSTLLFMMILMISGTSFSQDKQDWKYMHPVSQSNLLRKVKMVDESNWVANGGNGVFQHTSNSGANWYFQFFAGKVNSSTLATGQTYDNWFFDQNTGIVVGDQGYIGRTVNGGVTFDTAYSYLVPTNSRCWSIWFADANTGFIGAGSQTSFTTHILKTTNQGLNWSVVYSDVTGSTSYLTSLGGADANNVCATWGNGTCVRTTDGGSTWSLNTGQFPTIMNSVSFLNSTTGFSAGSGGNISRTTNAGLNWTSMPTPQTDWSYFQVKVVSASEIYVVGDPTYLYKSTDLGVTWSALPIYVSGTAVTFIWYSLDHYGSTYVLSGDYGQVAKSTDGCATWTAPGYFQLSTALMYDITTVPGTSKYWTVGRAFGSTTTKEIMYSSNSGANWTTYDVGVAGDFFSISMINEFTGYISGQNNRVMKTTDGGANWFAKTGPSPVSTSQLYTCEFIDENTGWVFVNFSTVAGGNVFKTTNGGDNWSQYTTGATTENIYAADMVDANTGFCVMNTSNRPIYRTTNGGVNWTGATTTGFTGSIRSITSPDGITVYACQTSGTSRVAKSTNGGVNWTLITLPATVDCNSIDFKDANTGYVSGNTTTSVCRTTNGGLNWTVQNTHAITGVKVYVTQGDTAWTLGGNTAITRFTGVNSNMLKLSLKVIQEGMYNPGTNKLARNDNVKVYLRNSTPPYAIKDSATAVIDSVTQTGLFTFTNATSGTYYLDVNYFNCLETWSKSGGETMFADGSVYSYDFTNAASKAFGNNQILNGTKYCMYSGDVNKDGIIDATDVSMVENAVLAGATGYIPEDLNGDYFVDASDLSICENNTGVLMITP